MLLAGGFGAYHFKSSHYPNFRICFMKLIYQKLVVKYEIQQLLPWFMVNISQYHFQYNGL